MSTAPPVTTPRWRPSGAHRLLERTTVTVPVDHARPDGPTIELAVGRVRAADPGRRRGVLVAINGGPGGDEGMGIAMPLRLLGTDLHQCYDIVGIDPRGFGESAPIHREAGAWESIDTRPDDAAVAELVESARRTEKTCARDGGELRRYVTTRNTARDLDLVRAALGEERLSYLGYAYGTYVGAVYATMFGDRTDRIVLDSCVHPDWLWQRQFAAQAEAIRANVDAWAAWTGRRHATYGLGRGAAAVLATVEELAAARAGGPVGGVDLGTLDGAVGNGATMRPTWHVLAHALGVLADDRSTPEARSALAGFAADGLRACTFPIYSGDERRVRTLLREVPPAPADHRPAVLHAITAEAEWPADPDDYRDAIDRHRREMPYGFGVLRALPWVSAFAEVPPAEPLTVLARHGHGPGLVVAADGDPLNHVDGARAMAERLGHHLVEVADDGGHELFGCAGHRGVDRIVTAYLVDGVLPARRTLLPSATARPAVPEDPT